MRRLQILKWLILLSVICYSAVSAAFLLLPGWLENQLPINVKLQIDHLSPWQAAAHNISIGPNLKIAALNIDYTPATLSHGRVNNINVNGAVLELPLSRASAAKSSGALPFSFQYLQITNSFLRCKWQGRTLTIPIEITAFSDPAKPGLLNIEARLSPRGQEQIIKGELDTKTMLLKAGIVAGAPHLLYFKDLLPNIDLSGQMTVKGSLLAALAPFIIHKLVLNTTLTDTKLSKGNIQLSSGRNPFHLRIEAAGQTVKLHSGFLDLPATGLKIGGLNMRVNLKNDRAAGSFSIKHSPAVKTAFSFLPSELPVTFQAITRPKAHWRLNWSTPEEEFAGQSQSLKAAGRFKLKGRTAPHGSKTWLNIRMGKINLGGLRLSGIKAELPFKWPPTAGSDKGEITIPALNFQKHKLGKARLELTEFRKGLGLSGRWNLPWANSCININGDADLFGTPPPRAEISFKNGCVKSLNNFSLGTLNPKLTGFSTDGDINLTGAVNYNKQGLKSHLRLNLTNVRLTAPDFQLQGGNLSLNLTSLAPLKSAARQTLSFKALKTGAISLAGGQVDFQIESPDSIFVERSDLQWCGGHVYTQAMRFSPRIHNYNLILHCDRLRIASLLRQFGVKEASGRGRVSGRIPIMIKNGRLLPQEGFLYSSPGEGGNIKVTGLEAITSGIPKGSRQSAQLDLARAALKDFHYDWARLDLNVQGNDLVMRMQVNGKPAGVLPFIFKRKIGVFVRVKGNNPGSRFQGIKLDVNFRLPLTRILDYGSAIKAVKDQIEGGGQ
ncbi:intermembrane phospholipid transport protein YdbH family protein [Desulfobacterota bacterium M19]